MTAGKAGRFALLDVSELHEHEEVERAAVESLVKAIERDGEVREPIWVSEGSHVILNGHHRFAALLLLGAARVPVWLVDYQDPGIRLERWKPGPPIAKEEVLKRGKEGRPFPPKTTRHSFAHPPPHRSTPLAELRDADPSLDAPAPTAPAGAAPRHARSRGGDAPST